jgi:hypothetical protein
MSEQAKRAYEAYAKIIGRTLYRRQTEPTGDVTSAPVSASMLPWEELPPHHREAWHEAVAAAVDEPQASETLTDVQVHLLDELRKQGGL